MWKSATIDTVSTDRKVRVVVVMDARDATLALLAARATQATICPSEVARALFATAGAERATASWRELMPTVHAAVDRLVTEGLVRLSWKGKPLTGQTGPYRIGCGERS